MDYLTRTATETLVVSPPPALSHHALSEECQDIVGYGVGLRQHRYTGLLQNLGSGQCSSFRSEIRISNPASCRRQVL